MPATLTSQERDSLIVRFDELAADGSLNLLTRRRFTELAALESDSPVVSLYIDLSPQHRHNNAWAIDLKTHARDALAGIADRGQAETVRGEIERMERRLIEDAPRLGRGAAFFSCPARELWFQVSLPLALPTRLRVGRRPYLRPLARIRDEHDRFGVVILDNQRARLFVSQLGHVQETADLFEDTPKSHKQGGWSQMRIQRHHDAHVMWHAGAVAQATEILIDRLEARHLLVAGTPQVLTEYRDACSPKVRKRWSGDFALPIEASVTEVAGAIAPLQQEVEAREEVDTIGRIHDSVSSGRGVWGLEPTLVALRERRVMTLVVHDRYRAPGAECVRCGLLLTDDRRRCPACNARVDQVEDLVDALLERAVTQEAELELVRSDRARALLPREEPVGALLRF